MALEPRKAAAVRLRSFDLDERCLQDRSRTPLLAIGPSPIHGWGAFALRRIRQGTRIIEYLGERITPQEADARYAEDLTEQPHVLLFTVDTHTVIDAGVGGNDARYLNHSCAPNCAAVTESRRVYIEALRTIPAGEELTYDYRLTRPAGHQAAWERRYACRCGADTCRGTMLAPRPKRRQPRSGRKARPQPRAGSPRHAADAPGSARGSWRP